MMTQLSETRITLPSVNRKLSHTLFQFIQTHLPLLRSLNQQKKWQLWISDQPILKKEWLTDVGLDKSKMLTITNSSKEKIMETLKKGIRSKNFSSIVVMINSSFTDHEKANLRQWISEENNQSYLFVITPHQKNGK